MELEIGLVFKINCINCERDSLYIVTGQNLHFFWQESKNNQNSWISETHSYHVNLSPFIPSSLSLPLKLLPWDVEVSSETVSNWAGSREGPGGNDNDCLQGPDTELTHNIFFT